MSFALKLALENVAVTTVSADATFTVCVAVGVVDKSLVPSDDLCNDIAVLPMTLVDLIRTFSKEPEPGIINLLLTPGEAVVPLAFHLV